MSNVRVFFVGSSHEINEKTGEWSPARGFKAEITVNPKIKSLDILSKITESDDLEQMHIIEKPRLEGSRFEVNLGNQLAAHAPLVLDGIARQIENLHTDPVRCSIGGSPEESYTGFVEPGVKHPIRLPLR